MISRDLPGRKEDREGYSKQKEEHVKRHKGLSKSVLIFPTVGFATVAWEGWSKD